MKFTLIIIVLAFAALFMVSAAPQPAIEVAQAGPVIKRAAEPQTKRDDCGSSPFQEPCKDAASSLGVSLWAAIVGLAAAGIMI